MDSNRNDKKDSNKDNNKDIIDRSVGINSIQSILKNATQSNLSFFHVAGNVESDSVLPRPSVADILDNSFVSKTSCTVRVKPGHEYGLRKRIMCTRVRDFVTHMNSSILNHHQDPWDCFWKEDIDKSYFRFYFDVRKMASLAITMKDIADTFQNCNVVYSPDFIGILDVFYERKGNWNNIILHLDNIIGGDEKIKNAIVVKDSEEVITLNVIGSSIECLANNHEHILFETLTVNDIPDIYMNFGIEAAREVIYDLLDSQKAGLVADFMCRSGEVVSIGRKSIKKFDRGFASYTFFERLALGFRELDTPRVDRLTSVYSKIWRGIRVDDDSYSLKIASEDNKQTVEPTDGPNDGEPVNDEFIDTDDNSINIQHNLILEESEDESEDSDMSGMYPNITKNIQTDIASMLEFRALDNKENLFRHQEFVRRYMSPFTPYKCLLIFHGLGSGKTLTSLKVAEDHYKHDRKKTIIITKGSSAEKNFKYQIQKFNIQCSDAKYYHYISLSNMISRTNNNELESIFSNAVVIMDEVHVIKNHIEEESVIGRLETCVNMAINSKFLFMTGTPMINNEDELNIIHKLCNTDSLLGYISYTRISINKPKYTVENIISVMGDYQIKEYLNESTRSNDIFKKITQISLFTTHDGYAGRELDSNVFHKKTLISMVVNNKIVKKGVQHVIKPEYKKYLKGDLLKKCSGKYYELLNIIKTHTSGKIFIFIEDVIGSGIKILHKILEENDYQFFVNDNITTDPYKRNFTTCTGNGIESPDNMSKINFFNSDENINGERLQILIGSKAIGESINLIGVKYFHYLSPHWNESMFIQSLGRTIRENSHDAFNEQHRYVKAYFHITILPSHLNTQSIDEYKCMISANKQEKIKSKELELIDISVDKHCYEPFDDYTKFNAISYYAYRMHNVNYAGIECIRNKQCNEFEDAMVRHIMINNILIHGKYVRCIEGKYKLVDNISIPYYTFNPIVKCTLFDVPFEKLVYDEKISFVERCIQENRIKYMEELLTLFLYYNGVFYHVLRYRHPSKKSYNASVIIPKQKMGPMRMFDGSKWEDVSVNDEQEVLRIYSQELERVQTAIDMHPIKYGIRSVLDNKIRVRGSVQKDRRKTQRGLELYSHSIDKLVDLATDYGLQITVRSKEALINSIAKFLSNNNLLIWL
ncbi:hypothetical protein HK099_000291 [Clydaea vesicula]|uniref:DNA-directed RNA polymerase n=1 Tax=Clydaea vesicula TaxID=447962 RepID=A0AAD5Y291_9FUNG|nr:hypothetical protein HK099_000291 [Clydaea vesicula]